MANSITYAVKGEAGKSQIVNAIPVRNRRKFIDKKQLCSGYTHGSHGTYWFDPVDTETYIS